jgi:hypothetical protein
MKLEESPAVLRHLGRHLRRIEAAAELPPPPAPYALMMGYEVEARPSGLGWHQLVLVGAAVVSPIISALALFKFDRPILATIFAVIGGTLAVGLIGVGGVWTYRRLRTHRNHVSIQMRRAATVVRAAELAKDLVSNRSNEANVSGMIWGVAGSEENARLSERMNGAIEGVDSVSTVLLSRGVTYGPSLYDDVRLREEARALRTCLNRLHKVVVDIVTCWLKTPPTAENKDKAHGPYKRYEKFLVEYTANADPRVYWGGEGSPLEIAESEPLPPFAR